MKRGVGIVLLAGLGLALFLGGVACSQESEPAEERVALLASELAALQSKVASVESKAGKLAAPPRQVKFSVMGIELKGSTSVDSLVAPDTNPATLSKGYFFWKPGEFDKADAKKWQVSSYSWMPSAMIALQGDEVTLRVFIVHGDKHATILQGPDGTTVAAEQVFTRGREYVVKFTASQQGHYRLVCHSHEPTMEAVITVLPRA